MPPRIVVSEENGLVLARVPCASAWDLIERLAEHGVRATYSIHAKQLIICFCDADRQTAQRVLNRCLDPQPVPSRVENARYTDGWLANVYVGQYM